MTGGDGNDRIRAGHGKDKVDAGAGDDVVNVRDREADTVDCGAGNDRVIADKSDTLTGCEVQRIRRGPRAKAHQKPHPKKPHPTRA